MKVRKISVKVGRTTNFSWFFFYIDWEQRKVSDLLVERNTQAPKSKEYPLMAFIGNEGVVEKGERYNRESLVSDSENKKYKRTEKGDFIYSSNNLETGSIGLNQYGNASISPVYSIFYPTELADSDFLGRRLVRKDFINQMIKWRQGVIYGQWRIHEVDFLKIEIYAPKWTEQKKIGDVFKYLDSLITLHQRKYDKLVDVKKSLLEKMFPQGDETTPKIRFKGFTETWEQRKLKECVTYRRGSFPQPYGKKEWYGGDGAMPFVQVADVSDDLKLVEKTKNTISKIAQPMSVYVPANSVVVTLQGTIGRVALTQYGAFFDRTVLFFDAYKQNTDKLFWAIIIQNKFENESKRAPGGTIKTITKEALSDFDLLLPENDEQIKLSRMFDKLNSLITLHQRKLEKLKNIKSALLEKMFV